MKIKDGYVLKEVSGNHIVVPVGNLDFNGVISLNETGVLIWDLLKAERTEADLAAALCAEYAIDEKTAAADIARFVQKLKEADLLA